MLKATGRYLAYRTAAPAQPSTPIGREGDEKTFAQTCVCVCVCVCVHIYVNIDTYTHTRKNQNNQDTILASKQCTSLPCCESSSPPAMPSMAFRQRVPKTASSRRTSHVSIYAYIRLYTHMPSFSLSFSAPAMSRSVCTYNCIHTIIYTHALFLCLSFSLSLLNPPFSLSLSLSLSLSCFLQHTHSGGST